MGTGEAGRAGEERAFDSLCEIFEGMINWPKRLAHEGPFYRELFGRLGVQSVVDVACGPGHHAAMFGGWGLRVQGADVSPAMIERARRNFGPRAGLEWVVRGYEEAIAGAFDAAICVGNSLALAAERGTVERAIGRMAAAATKAVVVHVANAWAWPDGPCVWQKCLRMEAGIVIKGVHRSGGRGFIEAMVVSGEPPALKSESVGLLLLEAAELEGMMRAAGLARVSVFGGYAGERHEREKSVDIVVVGEK
jgi:SAM-dependent methyltransferase